jgi:anaerobic C4-dicarboxylate transporter
MLRLHNTTPIMIDCVCIEGFELCILMHTFRSLVNPHIAQYIRMMENDFLFSLDINLFVVSRIKKSEAKIQKGRVPNKIHKMSEIEFYL